MHEFSGDDAAYLQWLDSHPAGYVINIHKSYHSDGARLHHARCSTLRSWQGNLTDPYVKRCADQLADLHIWATKTLGTRVTPCGRCNGGPASEPAPGGSAAGRNLPPEPGAPEVRVWADDYIRFPPRPPWQTSLSAKIARHCDSLRPSSGQVLHATFFGRKPKRTDIENLVLYNLGYSFKTPGANGIRFEHAPKVPMATDRETYNVGYRYMLAPRSGGFTCWDPVRTVASFDWTELGVFRREKMPAQVWLALARRRGGRPQPPLPTRTSFAVNVELRPPHGDLPRIDANLVKGVIDGVVSAYQSHIDASTVGEVAARLATTIPASPSEIAVLLLDDRWAVLGAVPRLVHLRGSGVQWNPADDFCDAGELLAVDPPRNARQWSIRGSIVELSPAQPACS